MDSTSSEFGLQRRRLLKGSLVAAGALLAGGGYLAVHKMENDTANMILQIGWLPGSIQIGEVVAKRLGYYSQEGLQFRIAPGGPSIDGVSVVASGSATLGQISSSPSIMLAVSQDIPIRCFATALQRHPFCFFSLKSNPVRSAKDMRGRKVGIASTAAVLLKAMLIHANIPESSVEVIPIGADMSPLLTGQVDVISGWLTNVSELRVLGADRVDLSLWDTGIHLYALPYYTTVETLEMHFDSIVRFTRATARGWNFARVHRDEAADLLVKEYPHLNRNDEREAIDTLMDFAFSGAAATGGWGTMEPDIWSEQIAIYKKLKQFTNHVPAIDQVMTTSVLDATRLDRARM